MNTHSVVRRFLPARSAALTVAALTAAGVVAAAPAAYAAAPSITSVSPAATVGLGAGESGHPARQVVIHVANVASTDGVTLAFPTWSGLSVALVSKTAVDATHTDVAATISTSSSSTAGSKPDLTLTDTTTSSSGTVQFTVVAAPTLTSLSPSHVLRGTTTSVGLVGTGLQTGVTLSAPAGSGVTFGAVTLSGGSTTTGTVPVTVTPNAPSGAVAVTVTNPDGGWSTFANALSVDTFAVTDVSPTQASNAAGSTAVLVTVTGTGIPAGSTLLRLTPTFTVTGQDPIVAAPTTISADHTTWQGSVNLASAAAGPYQVQLVNGSEVGTLTSKSFTVTPAGAPTVSSVVPTPIGQGADTTLTVKGTNFAHGASVSFGKAGITTTGPVVFDSATQLRVPVHVASSVTVGTSSVTVTNTGATPNSGSCSSCLSISAAPTITSLSPATLGQGASTTLTINGTNFSTTGTKASVVFGTGITATGSPNVTSTQIKIPVRVAGNAPASVSVKVQNPDLGTASTTLPIKALTLTGVTPRYVPTTFSGTLVLTGSGFTAGATVSFPAGSGVAVQSGKTATVSNTGTTVTVPVTVSRTSPLSTDVTVTNGTSDFGSVTCTGCLGVAVAPEAPAGVVATKSGTTATVSWTQVGSPADGGAPIKSYTVSVTAPANSGIAAQTLPASSTTATFSGLAADTDYTFALVATNAADLSSRAAFAGTSRQSRLELSVSDTRIVAGQSVRVHGVLRDYLGAPIVGAPVSVHSRADSGATRELGTVTTDGSGRWSVLARPRHNQTYYARFAGDATNAASAASPVRVRVQPRVTINAPAITGVGVPLVVRGHVSPNKSGDRVRLVALDSSGRVHRLGATFLGGRSSYRFAVPLGAGHWRLQVRIGRTGGNAAGRSPYLRVVRD